MSLHEDIVEYIRSGETAGQALGLEIEHFVVNDKGIQIGFDEVTELIREVAEKLSARIILSPELCRLFWNFCAFEGLYTSPQS